MNSHRHFAQLAGALGLAALTATVAACGSSSPSTSGSSSPPATSSAPMSSSPAASASSSMSTATAAITKNWEAFFNAKTPTSQRVALLQDGSQFATVIKSQAGSSLASLATAKVTHVTVTSPTQATVTYDILVSGTPQLKNQTGTAVLVNGTWKVGLSSFCGLLTLENGGKTSGLPPACKSAS